jgi:hypothetical protein
LKFNTPARHQGRLADMRARFSRTAGYRQLSTS